MDNIIIFAESPERDLSYLQVVFDQCRQAGMKLKPKKCDFLKRSVSFLGHVVDGDGIRADSDKIQEFLPVSA